jgi:hypothetical protein
MKPALLPIELETDLKLLSAGGVVEYFVYETSTSGDVHVDAVRSVLQQLESRVKPNHSPLIAERFAPARVSVHQFLTALRSVEPAAQTIGVLDDNPAFQIAWLPEASLATLVKVNDFLFNKFHDDLEIVRWSEGGPEWWGAFWWTVHNRTKHVVTVIAASATD